MSALDARVAGRRSTRPLDDLDEFFASRAADVDAGRVSIRDGIAFLAEHGLGEAGLERSIAIVARVARADLASAFSAWAHRMAIEYLAPSPPGSPLRDLLPGLRAGLILGATALATGTARYLAGTPLPIRFREVDGELRLDGRVPWASNLLPPFVAVTAAADAEEDRRAIVVAFTDHTRGATVAPYPELLALGATGSSSVLFDDARVPAGFVVSDDLAAFVERVLAPFLLLQSAFCAGLADRALEEAFANLGPLGDALRPELDRVRTGTERAERRLRELTRLTGGTHGPASIPVQDLLRLRLRWALLAREAVGLELASAGGRGYLRSSPTARRVREAAFLPIQAPTEVQLRWLLSHSA